MLGSGAAFVLTTLAPATSMALETTWPGAAWSNATPGQVGLDAAKLQDALAYGMARKGSGFIVRKGYRVGSWGNTSLTYDVLSTTKSFGSVVMDLAVKDGLVKLGTFAASVMRDFDVPPEANRATGWLPRIKLEHLATHTAGFPKAPGFTALVARPGTSWIYSDGGVNWLADALTMAYGRDLAAVLKERVLGPLQIGSAHLAWRTNEKRPTPLNGIERRELNTGIFASVDAMARVGLMAARGGRWRNRMIIDSGYAAAMRTTRPLLTGLQPADPVTYPNAPRHYGLLWWNNGDGTMPSVPRDAFWAWGANDSFILVVPSLDLVAARAGPRWQTGWSARYAVLEPFFTRLVRAVVQP
jgi:CubicO group peptidase (beta-lactamase class C family)